MHAVQPRLFYGWFVVAAAFVVTFVGFGSAYTFSSFVESLQRDFGASRGSVSLVFSFAGFLYFGLGVISGPLADRWGARKLAALGMALVGLGLMLASQAQTIVQVYAAYSIGIGAGVGCAYVPTLGAVQRWFVRRRGFASGLAVSGIGVGTLVMPPLATWLIASLGWRDSYLVLGVLAAITGIGSSLLIADDPRWHGTGPDGDPLDSMSSGPVRRGVSIGEAVRTPRFAGLYAACLISAFGVFVPFVHLVPFAVDQHVTPALAVLLLGMIGVGSTAGRFFLGSIADRIGRDTFLIAMYVGMAVSLAIWAIAGGFWSLTVFALLFGVFYGGWVAILPAVVTDHFGGRNVGGIIGILYTSVAIGTLLGPSAAGFAFDVSHSYFIPVAISAAANVAAAVIAMATLRTASPITAVAVP
ncbi:MFS transporter [Bradyrhizobium sp. ISRA443]|uniref:MFS transporter n=1 Tax=unclassified Bradyrhizobium TaxID=2631580 RepID=UPI00247A3337|nr:MULTISPECIES: MFS transporter [unclassified Bradyrhizobium]WGR91820.1 MFS transporter [Bradyrhizobium sp. ISRA435]WGS02187.1 MFS transporter [Bradyrhizobium sp. ISRA436]WGS09072.1 MFS transporter [Bradyrhizobium sp. ISRA437]WGS15961.1 MFS transporter [Bradyrhizobium sp. ISRA443]